MSLKDNEVCFSTQVQNKFQQYDGAIMEIIEDRSPGARFTKVRTNEFCSMNSLSLC